MFLDVFCGIQNLMSEHFLKIIQFWQHSEAQKILYKLHHAAKISFGKKKKNVVMEEMKSLRLTCFRHL